MKKGVYLVVCPVCGKILCRSRVCQFEIPCAKCHSNLQIELLNRRMTIVEISELGKEPMEDHKYYRRRGEALAG